ncbi:MAG: hypothetical protein PF508_02485, partial [Spirochaeta sp.]|nr:hypothetical protein [Spirochaeta sp.]
MNISTTVSGRAVRALVTITLVCGSVIPQVVAEESSRSHGEVPAAAAADPQAAADEPRHWGVVPLPLIAYTPDTGG